MSQNVKVDQTCYRSLLIENIPRLSNAKEFAYPVCPNNFPRLDVITDDLFLHVFRSCQLEDCVS